MSRSADTALERAQVAARVLPCFAGVAGPLHFRRLGGLTNLVFEVSGDSLPEPLLLRLPGAKTEDIIDRDTEKHAAEAMGRAGVSPKVLHFDASTGTMVAEFLSNASAMTPWRFRTVASAPRRAGEVSGRLHSSGISLKATFDVFERIGSYRRVLRRKSSMSLEGLRRVLRRTEDIRLALAAGPLPTKACHCDTCAENFLLDNNDRMWLVDWEYCGMSDPLWDLGNLASEADFEPDMEAELFRGYFGARQPSASEVGRWFSYKVANSNDADDFRNYAISRLRRCRQLMAQREFPRHLRAVKQGARQLGAVAEAA